MPKMKTHAGTKKRFKITGTWVVRRSRPGTSHLAPGKTQKRIRHIRKEAGVSTSDIKRISQQISNIR